MPGMLNMGEMGALALHGMLEMAKRKRRSEDRWVSVAEIADSLGASRHTLHKVVKRLVQAGLLDSSRGPQGGVKMRSELEDVTLLQIVEAVDGELNSGGCLFARRVCEPTQRCQFCGITQDLEKVVRDYFITTTLADLSSRLDPAPNPLVS